MPISFNCPACDHHLDAPDAAAGRKGTCKFCHVSVIAPYQSGQLARLADPDPVTASSVEQPLKATIIPPGAAPTMDPGGRSDSRPGGPFQGYSPPAGSPSGYRAKPPGDLLANPKVSKAFMCAGMPAIADFWKRFLAFGIDMVLITGIQILLAGLMLSTGKYGTGNIFVVPKAQFNSALEFGLTLFVAKVLYGAVLEGSPLQATLGKALLGMKVCTEPGGRVSFGAALWRNFCKWAIVSAVSFVPVLGIFPYFIFFYAMSDRQTQTLHDMLAGTVVSERYW